MWHWALVTLTNTNNNHFREIFKTILMTQATSWLHDEGNVLDLVDKLSDTSFKFIESMNKMIPISPSAFN
jgi:hypothetical protein